MTPTSRTLGIFARHPVPGRTKTRLASVIGDSAAARLARAFLVDLFTTMRTIDARRIVAFTPSDDESRQSFLSLAGPQFELWEQPSKTPDLGGRMSDFFQKHLAKEDSRVVLIGGDSPTLPPQQIEHAFNLLEHRDVVIGPATDGGFYLIGFRETVTSILTDSEGPCSWEGLFDGVDWGTGTVLLDISERLGAADLSLGLLAPWYDIDTAADVKLLLGHLSALTLAGEAVPSETVAELMRLVGDVPHESNPIKTKANDIQ